MNNFFLFFLNAQRVKLDLHIEIKKPSDCTEFEIDMFYKLVLCGNKVMKKGLRKRIENCKLLGFCYNHEEIIGISSIKRPQNSYKIKIIEKAGIERKPNELDFEIGYSYTKPKFRKKGISTEIKRLLLIEMENEFGIIFSTTAIISSQRFLKENGFIELGKSYDGDNDKNIKYYERKSAANKKYTACLN